MENISKEDIQFLDAFLAEELTEEGLIELDNKLKNPEFKQYYKKRLDQKFATSPLKLFMGYLPMILLIVLTIIGIYLIIKKIL